MIKLILIILTGVLSIVIIKQLRPEYSFLLRIAVLLTVLFSAVAAFSVLSDKIGESIGDAEINAGYYFSRRSAYKRVIIYVFNAH